MGNTVVNSGVGILQSSSINIKTVWMWSGFLWWVLVGLCSVKPVPIPFTHFVH
jgi:hypothetical protein